MKYDLIVIGGGASGLMAAYSAARRASEQNQALRVCVLEKMPRPARKVMITGKGRCNFTNLKDWSAFSAHIRSGAQFVRPAWRSFPPQAVIDWFESFGMPTVVERGDRAFPASHRSADVVDALVRACYSVGVIIQTEAEVAGIEMHDQVGHDGKEVGDLPHHIPRETPLTEMGQKLCGISLKNVGVTLLVQNQPAGEEFGDIDFTDGGIEGPIGFQLSRKAVKSIVNGSKAALVLDLKPGVSLTELTVRVKELWADIDRDQRSQRLREKERCRILLGKLMPWELIPAFTAAHPEIITLERRGRADTKVWVNLASIAKALKEWRFDLDGFVGWERAVVTAGGISTDEIVPKTLESRLVPGLFFCGESLDIDADTGGYNLQLAFCTGHLAGESASS